MGTLKFFVRGIESAEMTFGGKIKIWTRMRMEDVVIKMEMMGMIKAKDDEENDEFWRILNRIC